MRIGTPALATRGFAETEFAEVANIIAAALRPEHRLEELRAEVRLLTDKFPLYPELA